jgi:hypothetical protein
MARPLISQKSEEFIAGKAMHDIAHHVGKRDQ